MGHTPGPWTLDELDGHRVVMGGDGKYVCHVHKAERSTKLQSERSEANARLIRAAPEMVEALKGITAGMNDEFDSNPRVFAAEVKAARAAIALASDGKGE